MDSKLAVISLQLIEVDADESTEVAYEDKELFATLDVAMAAAAAAAVAAAAAAVVAAAAAAAATLRAALILFFLL